MIPLVKPFIAPAGEMMPEIEKILYSGYIAEGEKVYEFRAHIRHLYRESQCLVTQFRYGGSTYCIDVGRGGAG